MARFLDLVAVQGPDKGMRFSVEEGTHRVLCRAPDGPSSTQQITGQGDLALDVVQEQALNAAGVSGARARTRKRGPDIALRDASVSRAHALVYVDADKAGVLDLMSTNGTKLNGQLIRDEVLKPGDVIHVGKTKLRVDDG